MVSRFEFFEVIPPLRKTAPYRFSYVDVLPALDDASDTAADQHAPEQEPSSTALCARDESER